MFETMQSFYHFFFPVLALIILGILFEEKLVRLEDKLCAGVKKLLRGRSYTAEVK